MQRIVARIHWLLFVTSLLIVTSCGFHLRGDYQLPEQMSLVYISGSHSEFVTDLKRALNFSGITVVDDKTLATAVMTISKEKTEQRVLSMDENRRAREYGVEYRVSYSVRGVTTAAGEIRDTEFEVPERQIKLSRDYIYDTSSVLGTSRERATLIRDMQRDAARVVLLQLQAVKKSAEQVPSVPVKEMMTTPADKNDSGGVVGH